MSTTEQPIDLDPPAINLKGAPPDPATFDGPLNVFIGLHGIAVANNTATQTKKDYDELHPPALQLEPTAEQPRPEPLGEPIGCGHAIVYEKGVLDPGAARRRDRPARYSPPD
jgi:hypothetical protein